MLADLYGINVDLAIINKIWPATSDNASNSSDAYYTKWSNFQRIKVKETRINFYPIPVREIPLHQAEFTGIGLLHFKC